MPTSARKLFSASRISAELRDCTVIRTSRCKAWNGLVRTRTFARECNEEFELVYPLVPRVVHIAGYNLFSFTRASAVVNCQSALTCFLLRLSTQAATSSTKVDLSGMRRSRH